MTEDFLNREIEEMIFIQETVNKLTPQMLVSDDRQISIEYYHSLYALTEKQHVIFTRLKFSENPDDKIHRKTIEDVTLMTGRKEDEPMDVFFTNLKKEVLEVLEQLENDYKGDDPNFPY